MGARRPQLGLPASKAIINQRLIEGAQIPQPWNRPRGYGSGNVEPHSQLVDPELQSFRSDDHELDAFGEWLGVRRVQYNGAVNQVD
jgi:ATP-dependent DNA helicase HFM1/MER3